jgi:AraC-like DNA-binding protein
MDPLSDVLSLMQPRNYMSAGFDVGGDWSIRFPDQQAAIKTGAVVSGGCWLEVDGDVPVRLAAGDSFVLPSGRTFRLARDLALPSVEARDVFVRPSNGAITVHKGGGDCLMVSSRFLLDGDNAALLLAMLPPVIHIRDQHGSAALRWAVERMMQELGTTRPGGILLLQHLAHQMLIEALRLHLAEGQGGGWLHALADRQIGAAIAAMHTDPVRRWTVEGLAHHVGMSRSSFAERFRAKVGMAPMDYLIRWRMMLAGDRLRRAGARVADVAAGLGYESESAFSNAFRRIMGASPRAYARDRAAGAVESRAAE